ncbi:ion-transporting P-type ATPase [Paratrimastix pyriformis]|uniref:Ion-transporting P-type ATPase n=1 Tax=Paratrimastix pyriformis TaxID=342808 RepID=A0ABQ8UTI4_9EUKA|nr:ion-transporting P-type ATPase [Paratrimastix pyriformis]
MDEPAWHALPAVKCFEILRSNKKGLAEEEVLLRRRKYGQNKIPERAKIGPVLRFLLQFHNILIYILLAAAVLAIVELRYAEFGVIIGVVVIDAVLGFVQESHAEREAEAIKQMLSTQAVVMRSGVRKTINAVDLVPGDVVRFIFMVMVILHVSCPFFRWPPSTATHCHTPPLNAHTTIPQTVNLHTQESALTGESTVNPKRPEPITADSNLAERINMTFSGTLVVQGQGSAVVVATGLKTELGKISGMVNEIETRHLTPLTRQITVFGRFLAIAILIVAAISYGIGVAWGRNPVDHLFTAATIAVAAIPEGLPAIISMTLALGVRRLAQRKAIVRLLPAVETSGSVSVICSDKTGTLTANQITVRLVTTAFNRYLVTGTGYQPIGAIVPAPPHITLQDFLGEDQADRRTPSLKNCCAPESPTGQFLTELMLAGVLCNDATLTSQKDQWELLGDPTEGALLALAMKGKLIPLEEQFTHTRQGLIPFESEIGFMCTANWVPSSSSSYPFLGDSTVKAIGRHKYFLKGAPEVVARKCLGQATVIDGRIIVENLDLDYWRREMETMGSLGLRVLAIAEKAAPSGRFPAIGQESPLVVPTEQAVLSPTLSVVGPDQSPQPTPSVPSMSEAIRGPPLGPAEVDSGLVLLGLIGMFDPPREDSKQAIQACHRAGIKVVMITGDHVRTAAAIGNMLGLFDEQSLPSRANEVSKAVTEPPILLVPPDFHLIPPIAQSPPQQLAREVANVAIFARSTPADKLRVVKALQKNGHITAMTGDGVNDAPALKQSNVGLAMGLSGTEAAKEAADIILTDDRFSTIVSAVEEGRIVYDNLVRSILFVLPTNFAQALVLIVGIAAGMPDPLSAAQVLLVNIVTTVGLTLPIPFQRGEHDVLRRPPRNPQVPLMDAVISARTVLVGTLATVSMIVFFLMDYWWIPSARRLSLPQAQTGALNELMFIQIFFAFNCLHLKGSCLTRRTFSENPALYLPIVLIVLLQVALTYVPFMHVAFGTAAHPWWVWLRAIGCGIAVFLVVELEKWIRRLLYHRRQAKAKPIGV